LAFFFISYNNDVSNITATFLITKPLTSNMVYSPRRIKLCCRIHTSDFHICYCVPFTALCLKPTPAITCRTVCVPFLVQNFCNLFLKTTMQGQWVSGGMMLQPHTCTLSPCFILRTP